MEIFGVFQKSTINFIEGVFRGLIVGNNLLILTLPRKSVNIRGLFSSSLDESWKFLPKQIPQENYAKK
ncbi:CLUMA_CG000580, isoform A [Clunio marinus]|uniref:CLUMA_CG000580, isoform A n=1 Tax=Clunio marinus TaxID=568069 RepID=A0A1J1HFW2_9DIPT|nr:CLUMA_CG000580, isoform A [Clunio marinus]